MATTSAVPAPLAQRSLNPARARGLRRAGRERAPCEPVAWTPMPAPVDELHLLALLTRVRQARIDAGLIKEPRLYDLRAYKGYGQDKAEKSIGTVERR